MPVISLRKGSQRNSFVVLACIGFAALADALFYEHPWGVNAAVFAAAMVLAVVMRSPGLRRSWLGRVWVLVVGMSVLALVEEPSPVAVLMVVAGLGTLVLLAQRSLGEKVSQWIWQWICMLITLWLRPILDSEIGSRWLKRHPWKAGSAGRGARIMAAMTFVAWWVIPLAAGGLFILLFAVANPIIERGLRDLFDRIWTLLDWLPLFLQPDRVFLWVAVGASVYGLLRHRRMKIKRRDVAVPPVVAPKVWWLTGEGMIVRCLVVFNIVFGVQTLLDMVYLYGGAALPRGMTYAEYAHRGAYPLVATALLAGWFVLLTFKTGGAGHRSLWARRLVYLWIAQNLFLLVSTIWRIWLYVDVYSLTRLRVAAMIWVVLVGFGFCWVVGKIVAGLSNAWLWRMNTITLFGVLYVCAFINFDGAIADFNVAHCSQATGRGVAIDVAYLRDLGPDALPALQRLRTFDVPERVAIDKVQTELRGELAADLKDWRGWTYRRWREAPAEMQQPASAQN